MESVVLFLVASNLVLSAITLLIVGYQKVAPDGVPTIKPLVGSTMVRRSTGKNKPRWNDEAKEYHAEQKELKSRPPL